MTDNLPADSPELYKALLDNCEDMVVMIDVEADILYLNESVTRTLGHAREQILGSSVLDYVHPLDRETAITALAAIVAGEDINRIVVRVGKATGEWGTYEVLARAHENQGDKHLILNIRDVATQQATLDKLKASEKLLFASFNATSNICSMTDVETGEFIDVNDGWINGTGWQRHEAIGRTALDLNVWGSQENRRRIIEELRKNQVLRQFPAVFRTRTGETRRVLLDAQVITVEDREIMFLSAVDITEREEMEVQLRQSQRLEAVGQLTGGVAHDLNNMLTVVLGQVDLCINRELSQQAYHDALTAIRRATERGSELIRQLMIFSRRQTLKPSVINVARTVEGLHGLLSGSLGGEISITFDLKADTWDSYLDESLLENALLNLALNSRDAMPGGGELKISTENTLVDEISARRFGIPQGEYIRLSVADSGTGMDPATAANAFEPFFTTKPVGQGTGLGLSMVFGFVKQSGGHIEISSSPNEGTEVIVYVPRSTRTRTLRKKEPAPDNLLEGKQILVIEDSEELRDLVSLLLESLGCEVRTTDGENIEQLPAGKVDIVLSDVILPGRRQGPEIAQEVLRQNPGAKLLFMSGYPRERLSGNLLIDDSNLLKKPFSRQQLQEKLNAVLTRPH